MKNFGTLFGYELKKIWKRPLLWAAVLAATAVSVFSVLPKDLWNGAESNYSVVYKSGHVVSGRVTQKEKLRIELEWAPKLNERVMDGEFFHELRSSLRELDLRKSGAALRSDLEAYFLLVDPTYYGYYRYANLDGALESVTEQSYYDKARTLRQLDLTTSWYGKLTQEEIDHWTRLGDQVRIPYTFSYYAGWEQIDQALSRTVSWILPLLVGICLCGVFSEEHRDRTEPLIFSSRWGRFPVYLAKGLAGLATAAMVVLAVCAAVAVTAMLVYGGGWFDAPIQLAINTCWPITMGQGLLLKLGLFLAYTLLCAGVVMLVSLLSGSGVTGMAASVFMMMLQMFLPRYLLEAPWISGNILSPSTFHRYQLVKLFGSWFNWVELDLVLYAAAGLILLALCWLGWRRSAER